MFVTRYFLIAILALQVSVLAGGDVPAQGLTAQEYLDRAGRLFQECKYAESAALYANFEADFGRSKEGAELLRSVRFRQAMALVQIRRLNEARAVIEQALALQPPLPAAETQELRFWLGVAQLEEKNFAGARDSLAKFVAEIPAGTELNPGTAVRMPEARLLIGSAWMLEGKWREAAEHFSAIKSVLSPENRGRAVTLQLHALIEAGDNEAAMKLVAEESPRMGENLQIVTFQTLVLELGNRWLENRAYRKAIICLQRVWSAERLLKHQQARQDDLQRRLQAAEANPGSDPATKVVLAQLVEKVKRELEHFQKIPSFDAALRLRFASAYL